MRLQGKANDIDKGIFPLVGYGCGRIGPVFNNNSLVLFPKVFLNVEAFESNATSDWLNHTVKPICSCVTFKFTEYWRKRQIMFLTMIDEYGLKTYVGLEIKWWAGSGVCHWKTYIILISIEGALAKWLFTIWKLWLLFIELRVPRGSVVGYLTCNPGVLCSSRTGSPGFFRGSVLGQDTSEPSIVLVEPRKAWIMWAVAVIWLR